ncbi:transcriptional regulator [Marinicella pacifica]|uniref:Transcriptional regulator n=1 Tax=Marinicella pacifica TaxID=1171543 RepID=A0A917CP69_9GAMM|nr:helix-turn-helix domain-containing protein [Marinicella pacifica]GGF92626.1 transcriptional regulator [Marinicella pacifica]
MINKKDIFDMVTAAENDADQALPGLTQSLNEALAGEGVVHTPEQILLKKVRRKLGMNQIDFAELINTPVGTLRDWEQGRIPPSGAAITLAEILLMHPDLAKEIA